MKKYINEYFVVLKDMLDRISATEAKGKVLRLDEAMDTAVRLIKRKATSGGKLLFIGNGASAAISSHMATDFWKNGGIRAVAFNDVSGLTCIANDYGYKHVFEKPIEIFGEPNDILIAISSSGKSENILLGVKAASVKGIQVITFSGFAKDNPLSKLGEINFYVPSSSYGHVESIHQALCHCLVDVIIENKQKNKRRGGNG